MSDPATFVIHPAAVAEAESHKGVAGAVKKARKALSGQKKPARKPSKK